MPYATYLHPLLRRISDSLAVAVIHISIGQLGKMLQLCTNQFLVWLERKCERERAREGMCECEMYIQARRERARARERERD